MQISPSPSLSHIVKHFLIIENDKKGMTNHRMFSDGNTGMVFNYQDHFLYQESVGQKVEVLPKSFVYGQLDAFQDIISTGKIGMIITVFHPFGASALFKISASELKNSILGLDCFYPADSENMVDSILHLTDISSRINCVESFLIRKICEQNASSRLASDAVQLIHQHNGCLSVAQLTSSLQITERKLQRVFEEQIGLSPKRYSGITRIQYFLKLLRKMPGHSLTDLAYDSGYFDQAHLIREMKNISGITPGQYLNQTPLLAANLLQFPRQ